MNKPALRLALVFLSLALCCPVQAQQVKKAPLIGFLAITSPRDMSSRMAAFRQGLRKLGYIEGKTIVVDDRYAEGKLDRLRSMAAELVQLKTDVIVTSGPIGTRTAKEATATLPIVMAYDNDPVGFELHQLGCHCAEPIYFSLCIAIIHDDSLSLDIAQLA